MNRRRVAISLSIACTVLLALGGGMGVARAAALGPNETEVCFDGQSIGGLELFTYKVYKDRQDVRGAGSVERIGLLYVEAIPDENGVLRAVVYGPPGQVPFDNLGRQGGLGQGGFGRTHIEGTVVVDCMPEVQDEVIVAGTRTPLEFATWAMDYASPLLNDHWRNGTSFQIVVTIVVGAGPGGQGIRVLVLDGVCVHDRDFQLDAGGNAATAYTFTADRIREE